MTKSVVLEIDEWEQFKHEVLDVVRVELSKVKEEVREGPMTKEKTAKYLHCSESTVNRKFSHLKHMVDGTPYWFASELDAFIRQH